jgi:hypothetical protein
VSALYALHIAAADLTKLDKRQLIALVAKLRKHATQAGAGDDATELVKVRADCEKLQKMNERNKLDRMDMKNKLHLKECVLPSRG